MKKLSDNNIGGLNQPSQPSSRDQQNNNINDQPQLTTEGEGEPGAKSSKTKSRRKKKKGTANKTAIVEGHPRHLQLGDDIKEPMSGINKGKHKHFYNIRVNSNNRVHLITYKKNH